MINNLGTMKAHVNLATDDVRDLAKVILRKCKDANLTVKETDQALVLVKQELGKMIEDTKAFN